MTRRDSMGDIVCPECNGRGGLHFAKCPMDGRSNSKVTLEIDRDVAEFLAKTGGDAIGLLAMMGMGAFAPQDRERAEKIVGGIENWKKVRAAIKAAGVQVDD